MKTTEDGGRKTPFASGYRPNHVFEYKEGKLLQTYIGDIKFEGEMIQPGEERTVTVRFLDTQPIKHFLTIGRKWWIHEADKQLGEAEILELIA